MDELRLVTAFQGIENESKYNYFADIVERVFGNNGNISLAKRITKEKYIAAHNEIKLVVEMLKEKAEFYSSKYNSTHDLCDKITCDNYYNKLKAYDGIERIEENINYYFSHQIKYNATELPSYITIDKLLRIGTGYSGYTSNDKKPKERYEHFKLTIRETPLITYNRNMT